MSWLVGIDEAGYGPNLGPFVMSAVACRFEDGNPCDLWQTLQAAVRRRKTGKKDIRLHVDDSKLVHGSGGLSALERSIFSIFNLPSGRLAELVATLCPDDTEELSSECWHRGDTLLPEQLGLEDWQTQQTLFAETCQTAKVCDWWVRSVVVCPRRFNRITRAADSKGAVLSYAFIRLLRAITDLGEQEPLAVFVDKQGGRNTYAAQIQQAVRGMVLAIEESAQRSHYRSQFDERTLEVTFLPRADSEQFCVALASMVSKYLRELFMEEFNRFWLSQVPNLAPTAGYPADAPRFFAAIQSAAQTLQIPDDDLWRHR